MNAQTIDHIKLAFPMELPERFVPRSNFVLVQITEDFIGNTSMSAGGIVMDHSWNKQERQVMTGIVAKVPEKLIFLTRMVFNLEWDGAEAISDFDVDMELQEGDQIIFHYLSLHRAQKNGLIMHDKQDRIYAMIRYDKIYLAKRGDEYLSVNGQIILEKVRNESSIISNHIEIFMRNIMSLNVGKVRHVASPVKRYFAISNSFIDKYSDHKFVRPGDVVFYYNSVDLLSERYINHELFGLQRINEKEVIAVVRKGKIVVNSNALQVEPIDAQMSDIILNVSVKKNRSLAKGRVINAPENWAHLLGAEVWYEKGYELTFDYKHKSYTFAIQVYDQFEPVDGTIILTD